MDNYTVIYYSFSENAPINTVSIADNCEGAIYKKKFYENFDLYKLANGE